MSRCSMRRLKSVAFALHKPGTVCICQRQTRQARPSAATPFSSRLAMPNTSLLHIAAAAAAAVATYRRCVVDTWCIELPSMYFQEAWAPTQDGVTGSQLRGQTCGATLHTSSVLSTIYVAIMQACAHTRTHARMPVYAQTRVCRHNKYKYALRNHIGKYIVKHGCMCHKQCVLEVARPNGYQFNFWHDNNCFETVPMQLL